MDYVEMKHLKKLNHVAELEREHISILERELAELDRKDRRDTIAMLALGGAAMLLLAAIMVVILW